MKEKRKLHKLLGILLSFMLVVGLMPAMSTTAFAATTISKVEASGVKVPVAGELIESDSSPYVNATLPSGQGYEQLGVILWYEDAACDGAPFYGPFVAGKKYYAVVNLEVAGDYQFADDVTVLYEGKEQSSKKVYYSNQRLSFTVEFTCVEKEIIPCIRIEGLKYPMLMQMPVSLDNVVCWACIKDGYTYDEVEKLDVTDLKWERTSDNGATWSYFYEDGYSVSDSPIRYGYKYRVSFTVHPKETACGNTLSPLVGDKNKEEKEPYTVFSTVGFSSYNSSFVYKWAECIDNGDGSFTFRSYHYPEEYEIKDISTSMQNYALGKPADNVGVTSSTVGIDVSKVELVTREGSEDTKAIGNIKPFTEYWAKVSLSITGDNKKIYEFTDYNYLKDYHGVDSERYIEYRDAIKLNGIKADDIIQDKSSGFSDDYNITVYFKLPMFVSDKATKLSYSSTTYNGKVKSPTVSVVDAAGNKLVEGTDYDVTVPSGRTNAGTYTYKVNFKGNYEGSKSLNLTINQASYTPTVKGYSGTYNGKKHTVSLSGVKSGSAVKYRTSSKGTWTTTKPTRTSVGKTTVYYQITNKNYKTVTGSKTIVINPVKTSITSLKKGTKSFTVKWAKKATQTTGYQIQYSTSSKFAKGNKTVTVSSNKTTGKTIKGLKTKKKYYVRVRTYKTVSGVKYYSGWSAKKYVTTK